jgi:sn-1 stearoyl-lipid 9-desaturase
MSILYLYFLYIALSSIGATYGLHRYWAHRQGKRRVWFEWLTLSCALSLGVYKPLGWIGVHRLHHKHADTKLDPHSPKHKGLKVLISDFSDTIIPLSVIRDVVSNPRIKFFQKYGRYLVWFFIIFTPYFILMAYAGMGILNYFGHHNNKAVNRWWINILAPFEGNHKDHHSW